MITTLLTDLDGVLRIWESTHLIEQQHGLPQGTILQTAFTEDILHPVITGRTTDDEWRQQIATRLHEAYPTAQANEAVQSWSLSAGQLDTRLLLLFRTIRPTVRIGLVTNATSRLLSDLERLHLLTEFDAIINSSDVGAAKPDPAFYHAALKTMNAEPAQTLFIDDSLKNVQAAKQFGLFAHHYTDFHTLRMHLIALGVLKL